MTLPLPAGGCLRMPAAVRHRRRRPACALTSMLLLASALCAAPCAHARADDALLSHQLSAGPGSYCVVNGDTLLAIAARHGEPLTRLLHDNALQPGATLRPGRCLRLHNPHVVPGDMPTDMPAGDSASEPAAAGEPGTDGLVVNVAQRMAFRWHGNRLAAAHAVAVGRPDWQTPTGAFRVVQRRRHPVWHVPASIQQEMQLDGKPVQRELPAGPDNPLGAAWIGLDAAGYGIHGTNAPASLYSFRTHGCIRMHDADVGDVFDHLRIGSPVRIIYRTWLLAELPDGALWLEADPDPYRRSTPARGVDELRALAREHGLEQRIDWSMAKRVMARRAGLAERVDLPDEPHGSDGRNGSAAAPARP